MSLNSASFQRGYPVVDMPHNQAFGSALLGSSSSVAAGTSTSQIDTSIDIQIRNVVCNYVLPLHVDLKRVAMNTGNVTFDRNRGVLLKQKRNPQCYVKIYNTGKVYIVGCRSEAECKKASRQIARLIQRSMDKLHETVRIRNYQVCNILATCKMPFGIKIEEIAQKYPQTNYEPEISVGLIWKHDDPKATLRIHTTGSVTVTGATSEASVTAVLQKVYPILKQFGCAPRHLDSYEFHCQQMAAARRKRLHQTQYAANRNNLTPPEFFVAKRPKTSNTSAYYDKRDNGPNNAPSSSGVYGNKMYFSDEEDLDEFSEDFFGSIEEGGEYEMDASYIDGSMNGIMQPI